MEIGGGEGVLEVGLIWALGFAFGFCFCCHQVFILGLFKKVSPGGGQGEAPSTQQGTRNGAVSNVEQVGESVFEGNGIACSLEGWIRLQGSRCD